MTGFSTVVDDPRDPLVFRHYKDLPPATIEQVQKLAELHGLIFRVHPMSSDRPQVKEVWALYTADATDADIEEGRRKHFCPKKVLGFYSSSPIQRYIDFLRKHR